MLNSKWIFSMPGKENMKWYILADRWSSGVTTSSVNFPLVQPMSSYSSLQALFYCLGDKQVFSNISFIKILPWRNRRRKSQASAKGSPAMLLDTSSKIIVLVPFWDLGDGSDLAKSLKRNVWKPRDFRPLRQWLWHIVLLGKFPD